MAEILFGIWGIEVYLAQLHLATKHKHITVSLYLGFNLWKQRSVFGTTKFGNYKAQAHNSVLISWIQLWNKTNSVTQYHGAWDKICENKKKIIDILTGFILFLCNVPSLVNKFQMVLAGLNLVFLISMRNSPNKSFVNISWFTVFGRVMFYIIF